MRVVIITSMDRGPASDFLPSLAEHPNIDIAMVVLSQNIPRNRWKLYKKKARKLRRIGLLGGLVGLRLRKWNDGFESEDLPTVARRLGLRLEETPRINCERTRELFREAEAGLGLALGTALIARSVFSIPEHGMINIHGDVLPRFRGGMSIIWPIYEGVAEAGFTIHEIDRGIDTGRLLHVERFPIRFKENLRATYRANVVEIRRRVPRALVEVVARYDDYVARSSAQGEGQIYTTPSLRQFLRMRRQHRRLSRAGQSSRR